MLVILHTRWIIETKCTIMKIIYHAIYKAGNVNDYIACYLILQYTILAAQCSYRGNYAQQAGNGPW